MYQTIANSSMMSVILASPLVAFWHWNAGLEHTGCCVVVQACCVAYSCRVSVVVAVQRVQLLFAILGCPEACRDASSKVCSLGVLRERHPE
jgi:hypothetical protein